MTESSSDADQPVSDPTQALSVGAPAGGEPLDPMRAFAELGQLRLSENDLRQVLGRIAELAKRTVGESPGVV